MSKTIKIKLKHNINDLFNELKKETLKDIEVSYNSKEIIISSKSDFSIEEETNLKNKLKLIKDGFY